MLKQILIGLFLLSGLCLHAQRETTPPGNEIDYSGSQITGFTLISLGTCSILYNTVGIEPKPKHPEIFYIGGGVAIAAGIAFLIWGDKEKDNQPNYWKGLSRKKQPDQKPYLSMCPPLNYNHYENR